MSCYVLRCSRPKNVPFSNTSTMLWKQSTFSSQCWTWNITLMGPKAAGAWWEIYQFRHFNFVILCCALKIHAWLCSLQDHGPWLFCQRGDWMPLKSQGKISSLLSSPCLCVVCVCSGVHVCVCVSLVCDSFHFNFQKFVSESSIL